MTIMSLLFILFRDRTKVQNMREITLTLQTNTPKNKKAKKKITNDSPSKQSTHYMTLTVDNKILTHQ